MNTTQRVLLALHSGPGTTRELAKRSGVSLGTTGRLLACLRAADVVWSADSAGERVVGRPPLVWSLREEKTPRCVIPS